MNTLFSPAAPKAKPKVIANDSILESIRNVGSGVASAVVKDVAGKVATDTLTSLLGQMPKTSGELKENQSIEVGGEKRPVVPVSRGEAPRAMAAKDAANVREQLTAVRQELKALAAAIKNFNSDVQKAIDEVPVNPGVYHVNFLGRLRSILKILREQIEDSRTWLALSTGRKQKRQYWGLYKKHGTQFGLSSERTLATQAG